MGGGQEPLATALADRYRIERELGQGGMATVYLAEDLKHQRKVAVKVLRPELAAALGHDRFLREITTTANLRHPHILPLYDSGEAAGFLFYVMPFVEGESLRGRLEREGQLSLADALRITREVADALGYAHGRGVIHRDIKPDNILLERGHAVVADFGIARAVRTAGADKLTQTGMAIGTPAYMSPEQSVGEADLDARSDLYALGCVLYEMLAGEPPYTGPSAQAIIAKRFREPVPQISTLRETVPPGVEAAINRVLAKSPADRFATAEEFAAQLGAATPPAGVTSVQVPPRAAPAITGPSEVRARGAEGFWVAVLQVKYTGGNTDLTALAEGLTEEIVTGLSRFSYLRVVAPGATAGQAHGSSDPRSAGAELGARYLLEGSLRQSGSRLRIAVQLVDATSGANLWAESYDHSFSPEALFDIQDEVVPRIVSTVADMNGILPHFMSEALRARDPAQLTPDEAVLRSLGYTERITAEEHAEVRTALERAVRAVPNHADAWAMLSFVYAEEHKHGFNPLPDPLGRALEAARRAVAAAPANQLAYHVLAQAHFFRREFAAFRNAADRAVALNAMDGCTIAFMGILIAYAGDQAHGCALAERAMQLNPHHPGWYRFAAFWRAYGPGDYSTARDIALKFNMPSYFYTHMALAAAYGQLGDREGASRALRELLAQKPDFARTVRQELGKWVVDETLLEQGIDGLRKAGLDIDPVPGSGGPSPAAGAAPSATSGATRTDEGFWLAVLPFKYSGGSADLTALAEGLTEEIVTGLSRFSYLRVTARNSTRQVTGEAADARSVGEKLGARYVLDGSLRQAGAALRVSAQLVDTDSGAHLWAETYDRSFGTENIFVLQDDLAPRIVSTVADAHGILPHTLSEALRHRNPDQLSPYEAVLRSFGYGYRMTAEEHAEVRAILERAVRRAPGYSDAWGMLSLLYTEEFSNGFNALPDPLERAVQAARRAADAAPSSALAYNALARALFFRKEFQAFRIAADRALELNPLNGPTLAGLGGMMAYAGDWEHGCAQVERAARLNPRHPGGYWFAPFYNAYRKRDYREALRIGLKINLPDFFATYESMAAVYGQLGDLDAAARCLRDLLRLKPEFPAVVRAELAKWFDQDLSEHVLDGLRKAGLEGIE